MNKILLTVLVTGGLMLLDSPEAAAKDNGHDKRSRSGDHYSRDYDRDDRSHRRHHNTRKYKRPSHVPYWLKHDREFRRWLKHSHWHNDRRLSWNRLFEIYRYEHHYSRHYNHHYRRY